MHDATAKGGQATTQHLFVLDLPNVSYMAMYTSYTYNLGGSERSMDDFRDSFLKGMQAKLVDEKPTGLAGLHGRIIHAESTDGKMEAYLRLYVARRRLYQFLVMKPKGAPLSADDLKFFESLQFISVTPP